ncbi:MAG: 5-deoxy-glucuronate isomerase [Sphaerochaetaceae bacterium]
MKYTYTTPFSYGLNTIVVEREHPDLMGLNFAIAKIQATHDFILDLHQETLVVLLSGAVTYTWSSQQETVQRRDPFHEPPSVLHLNDQTSCKIRAEMQDAELIVVATANEHSFNPKLYRPDDLASIDVVGEEILGGKTKREKRVFFDRTSCPQTNLFCGELVTYPGCWACYPPHLHTEPEIYYYRFFPESGYGFSEQGDTVFKVKQNDLVGISEGKTHSQVTAPGYAGFIFWAQKLQDNGKDIDYRLVQEHAWLDAPDATYFPNAPSI